MFQTNLDKRSLRSALLLGAASAAAIGFSGQALAQDQSTETVVVTGSRIPQQGLYSPSPVTAIGQQEMKFEGTTGVETLLNNLPSVFADQTSGVSNGATGTATVDLRGLGSVRTLVLVNGTRLAPGDPKVPVADLNQIPAALVDHVEVLTGGASAVYGSDALAGVVNFVMRKDFEGIEFDGQYGIAEADNTNGTYRGLIAAAGDQEPKENILDGANETGTLIMGTNTANGKGNVTAYLAFNNTEPVFAGARDFGACTLGTAGAGHACAGSSNFKRFISLDNASAASQPYDFFENGTGAQGSGSFVPYTGANNQHFNFGALNYLQRPDTRYSGGFFAHYEVNKELDIYSSFMFSDDHTVAEIAPRGLFLGVGAISGAFDQINCNNPFLVADPSEATALCGEITPGAIDNVQTIVVAGHSVPNPAFGETLATAFPATVACPLGGPLCNGFDTGNNGAGNFTPGQALLEIGRRAVEGGNLATDLRHTSYRMQVGARGDLGDGWSYDVYGQYSTSLFTQIDTGFFSIAKTQQALEAIPGTGAQAGQTVCASGTPPCVPLNIFDGLGSITKAMLGFVQVPGIQLGYTEEQILSGNLTGDLGEYGIQSPFAKSPVAVSFGSEYRAEYLQLTTDEEYQSGDLAGAGGATLSQPRAGFNVVEGFGEIKVPLVQDKPFVEDLSFNAGYRYSSYSTAGAVSAYKYGAEYQPVDDVRFRASYERAVRAPNVLEAFSPDNVVLISAQDPCSGTASSNACAGVPHSGTALLECPANQCNQLVGGNASLKPEIGDTRSIGVVLTPTFLDGFTATVDYFNIDVTNAISSVSPTVTLAQCYPSNASGKAPNAFFCSLVHRSAGGQIFGAGFVTATTTNTGFEHTKGWDMEANYNFNFDSWSMTQGYGALQFAFVGTYLQSFAVEPLPGLGSYDCAGLYGQTCGTPEPKWRHRLRTTWATPWDVDFSANWRYLNGVNLDTNTTQALLTNGKADVADRTINDYWYLDLAGDWNVREGVSLHAGVNNVFDRLPPALSSGVLPTGVGNDNTFPGTYDSLGRTFFVGATIKY